MYALHQILSSNPAAARDCRALIRPGDQLLLVDDGVELLWNERGLSQLVELAGAGRVRALRPDVEARGLLNHAGIATVPLLTDAEWVVAVQRSNPILSWK